MKDQTFKFRLERVHSLRRAAERSAQEDLAASLGRHRDGEQSLRLIEATLGSAREKARHAAQPASGWASGSDLRAVQDYLTRLASDRESAARELDARQAEVENRRRELLAAARERQALDRLRGRRRSEHEREVARAECARLDELAIAVHRRRAQAA